ncbi:hypothetical protein GCM10023340_37590 [Nocardioides marinquilinus]|uniref:Uncharacterized protein n=1 Tax=Nocardioides marinquilinus TaxID=1210400 RepID=A0ABP9PYI5_9ACTN
MVDAAQLAAEVRRATEETPYTVTDETPDGFTVQIDVVDQKWWTLMYRRSLSQTFRHVVRVDAEAGTYDVTDKSATVEWAAGADVGGGVPRPTLKAQAGFSQGTFRSKSFRKELGVDDDGNVGAVVDYSFDSAEGNRLIDEQAQRLGLTKKMNKTARIGLVFALVGVLGALVAGVVLVVLAIL